MGIAADRADALEGEEEMSQNKFGEEFRALRREAGKTMADVADALDCSVVYIGDIERNRRNPPLPMKIRMMLRAIGREECLKKMLRLAARSRESVRISLKRNRGEKVADMLVALARRADEGKLDEQTAEKITRLLRGRERPS